MKRKTVAEGGKGDKSDEVAKSSRPTKVTASARRKNAEEHPPKRRNTKKAGEGGSSSTAGADDVDVDVEDAGVEGEELIRDLEAEDDCFGIHY
ncbi:hypothetical protein L195_g022261 [Trifolium pratense]|uniref:Uncharacterized protein n=1 Tax=Trifolium pratense TaxID=57577 RepID=A0A2K3N7K1_TRIPR|nr:hypothetical protein L195_g022261 [Trifolium pratense]